MCPGKPLCPSGLCHLAHFEAPSLGSEMKCSFEVERSEVFEVERSVNENGITGSAEKCPLLPTSN